MIKSAAWLAVVFFGGLVDCSWKQAGDGGVDAAAAVAETAEDSPGSDTSSDVPADCGPLDAGNDPRCPERYGQGACGQVCLVPALSCAYPNVGDGPDSRGCLATAMMWCMGASGDDGDAGDAHVWVCAQ